MRDAVGVCRCFEKWKSKLICGRGGVLKAGGGFQVTADLE